PADRAIWRLLLSPRLVLNRAEVTPLGEDTWQIRVVVDNSGWLPTNVTQKAMERKVVQPLEAELTGDVEVVGERKLELGQLSGRALKESMLGPFGAMADATNDRAKAEWVVRGPAGSEVSVEVRHQRAGVVRVRVPLTLGN